MKPHITQRILTTVVLGCALGPILAHNVLAADDPMAAYYDATLIRMDAHSESKTWYDKDHTLKRFSYELTMPSDSYTVTGVEGTYRITGGPGAYQLCEKLNLNIPESCAPFVPHKVGDAWDAYKPGGAGERWQLVGYRGAPKRATPPPRAGATPPAQ